MKGSGDWIIQPTFITSKDTAVYDKTMHELLWRSELSRFDSEGGILEYPNCGFFAIKECWIKA